MEPRDRKRKSTDRGSDGGSSDDEQEIEEEQVVPLVQHQPGQGMHYGLLETHPPSVPSYVSRVDYRGKGMTRRARDERRIDPRSCLGFSLIIDFRQPFIWTSTLV